MAITTVEPDAALLALFATLFDKLAKQEESIVELNARLDRGYTQENDLRGRMWEHIRGNGDHVQHVRDTMLPKLEGRVRALEEAFTKPEPGHTLPQHEEHPDVVEATTPAEAMTAWDKEDQHPWKPDLEDEELGKAEELRAVYDGLTSWQDVPGTQRGYYTALRALNLKFEVGTHGPDGKTSWLAWDDLLSHPHGFPARGPYLVRLPTGNLYIETGVSGGWKRGTFLRKRLAWRETWDLIHTEAGQPEEMLHQPEEVEMEPNGFMLCSSCQTSTEEKTMTFWAGRTVCQPCFHALLSEGK